MPAHSYELAPVPSKQARREGQEWELQLQPAGIPVQRPYFHRTCILDSSRDILLIKQNFNFQVIIQLLQFHQQSGKKNESHHYLKKTRLQFILPIPYQ